MSGPVWDYSWLALGLLRNDERCSEDALRKSKVVAISAQVGG